VPPDPALAIAFNDAVSEASVLTATTYTWIPPEYKLSAAAAGSPLQLSAPSVKRITL
jgi:hypothetical protein